MSIAQDKRFMRRFEAGKEAQIEQLISYVTLLGLSGNDLIAVGGKLEREKLRQERIRNDEIVASYKLEKIGSDDYIDYHRRFKVRTLNGAYNFESESWNRCIITNPKTKVKKYFTYENRPVSAKGHSRQVKQMVLALAYGDIKLDF